MIYFRVRLRFRKRDDIRWISHHDLVRTFERWLRRAGLPLRRSEGFHPKPKLSFPSALALGIAALDEVLEFELTEPLDLAELRQRLDRTALPGLEAAEILTVSRADAKPQLQRVAYSTTSDIADPHSWTAARPILDGGESDPRREGGLDYWIICDDQRAYLFLTSLNGKMWRLWTRLEDFPRGFDHCELALEAKIFEASHTYRLKDQDQYLTIIEENGRRYYKA